MIPLLKMYDDFTSNKYVSLGISVVSTAYLAYSAFEYITYMKPTAIVISACAGSVFALLANSYLIHNDRVKSEGEKNSIYASLSLFSLFTPLENSRFINTIFNRIIANPLEFYGYSMETYMFSDCFKMGFSATILALQLLGGKTKIELQSPIKFS